MYRLERGVCARGRESHHVADRGSVREVDEHARPDLHAIEILRYEVVEGCVEFARGDIHDYVSNLHWCALFLAVRLWLQHTDGR